MKFSKQIKEFCDTDVYYKAILQKVHRISTGKYK